MPDADPDAVVAQTVAWDRGEAGLVSTHNFMVRYSVQHVCRLGADHAVCGAKILWPYLAPGDSRKCGRCFALAEKHGYVTEYGDPLV